MDGDVDDVIEEFLIVLDPQTLPGELSRALHGAIAVRGPTCVPSPSYCPMQQSPAVVVLHWPPTTPFPTGALLGSAGVRT